MANNYFEHSTNVRYTEGILAKSKDWQWFFDYIEQNFQVDLSCSNYNEFCDKIVSIRDIFAKLVQLYTICGDINIEIHSQWLKQLDCIAQIACGNTSFDDYEEEDTFCMVFALLVELTRVFNQTNNCNYSYHLCLFELYNYFELYDLTPLQQYTQKIETLLKRFAFPEFDQIIDVVSSNLKQEKRPFSRQWLDDFTEKVFQQDDIFQYQRLPYAQFSSWQERFLVDMLRIRIGEDGIVPLFSYGYSTNPDFRQWTETVTDNMLDYFSGERVLFIVETIRFLNCNIPMSEETTIQHLNSLVAQVQNWENSSSFLFGSSLALYAQLKKCNAINGKDFSSSMKSLKEATASITDIGILCKLDEMQVPLDAACKQRLEEHNNQKCECAAQASDAPQLIDALTDTYIQRHVSEAQFIEIHNAFYRIIDNSDVRFREILFYDYLQFLFGTQTNSDVPNDAVEHFVIELLHKWQDQYYSQSISSMAQFSQSVKVTEQEITHLNESMISNPFTLAYSVMRQSPEEQVKGMEEASEHAILFLASRMVISPFFPYRPAINLNGKSRIENKLLDQVRRLIQQYSYRFLNILKPVQYFERYLQNTAFYLRFWVSVFSGEEALYNHLIQLLGDETLLEYSNEPLLGHITQFFPILERKIRFLGELFNIPPCKLEKDSYMQLKEPASILTEILLEALEYTDSFEGASDLLFVYFAMYYLNGINLRNDCVHGNGYRTPDELRFAFKLTLICMNMILWRIHKVLNSASQG